MSSRGICKLACLAPPISGFDSSPSRIGLHPFWLLAVGKNFTSTACACECASVSYHVEAIPIPNRGRRRSALTCTTMPRLAVLSSWHSPKPTTPASERPMMEGTIRQVSENVPINTDRLRQKTFRPMSQRAGNPSPPSLSARPATGGRSDAAPAGAAAEGSASPVADAADVHNAHGANDRGATRLAKYLAHRANPVATMRDACAFAGRASLRRRLRPLAVREHARRSLPRARDARRAPPPTVRAHVTRPAPETSRIDWPPTPRPPRKPLTHVIRHSPQRP